MKLTRNIVGFALVALVIGYGSALATPITFTGSGSGVDGATLSAEATFQIVDNSLFVTLRNTATNDETDSDKDVPANTLTGIFFDLEGDPTLAPFSATINDESLVNPALCNINGPPVEGCSSSETNVGGEFAYATSAGLPGGADRGISSAGLGIFGDGNFNGPNLDGPEAVNGINFGILSTANVSLNGGLQLPLILELVMFELTFTGELSLDDISNVSFQYGTSLTEPNVNGECIDCPQDTPEPSSLLLLGCGLAVLGLYRRRKT